MSTDYYFSNSQRNSQAASSARTPAGQNPTADPRHHRSHQDAQDEVWRGMVEVDPMAREIESLSAASRSSSSSSSTTSSPRR
ncbi:hypothetical protein RB595_004109 [Gaeumannomyces hyphopodioides]